MYCMGSVNLAKCDRMFLVNLACNAEKSQGKICKFGCLGSLTGIKNSI